MLYPGPDNIKTPSRNVVIDFQRPKVPLLSQTIIIPVHPTHCDMLQVHGDTGDIWLAHVLASDKNAQTCKVHFYIPDPSSPEESHSCTAVETIRWDSILNIGNGIYMAW